MVLTRLSGLSKVINWRQELDGSPKSPTAVFRKRKEKELFFVKIRSEEESVTDGKASPHHS